MAERGIILVPTLCVFDSVAEADSRSRLDARAREVSPRGRRKTVAAATPRGADGGGRRRRPHGENARELVRLVEAGLSAHGGGRRGDEHGRARVPAARRAGTIEPGKVADLLVLDGDPLEDVRLFLDPARRWLVLQEGRPVAGTGAVTAG